MLGDKFITGHWDSMNDKSRQVYLENRTFYQVVRALCVSAVVLVLGGFALYPSCQRADIEMYEQRRSIESQPAYQIRAAYEHCVDKCFQHVSEDDQCTASCGESVSQVFKVREGSFDLNSPPDLTRSTPDSE